MLPALATGLPPLASVEDVETLYGPVPDGDVARVGRLLEMASAAVRRFTRQTLSLVVDDVVNIPSSGTTVLVLAERPVVSVDRVEVQHGPGWWWFDGSPDELPARAGWAAPDLGRFTWDAFGQLRRLDGLTWGARFDPVEVTYTHGYDPVPADLVGLVAGKVASFMAGAAANPEGLRSLQVGAMSETYSNPIGSAAAIGPAALSEAEQDMLRDGGYRLGSVSADIGAQ